MFLIQIVPLTKIPHTLPQILSYFSGQKLFAGSLIQIPLGKRKANGVVIGVRAIADHKMEIKRADFELRNIAKIISAEPILTEKQIKLALFLGQYYFASPGLFAKMMFTRRSFNAGGLPPKQQTTNNKQQTVKKQTLIVFPTISQAENYAKNKKTLSLWHSGLTAKQLNESWWKIKNGRAQTIIGTRSAVFLPFTGLKKIIIVDESNPNHKSWDMFPHYRVHEVAQKLAEIFNAKLTIPAGRGYSLRATTPSLSAPRILWGGTPPCAYSRAPLNPTPTIIDMRAELKSGNFSIFSVDLYEAVKNALEKKKQVILFINRRGAANFILCRDCGYIAKCPNCDAPLAYHLINNKPSLLCHHCGAKDTPPTNCPKCNSWRIKTVGSGTQKVEAEMQKFFPDAKILRLDGDIAPKPKNQQKIITDFIDKKGDISGRHEGLQFYTIGQRKGIKLSGGPYFVVKKDFKNNNLIVSKDKKDLLQKELIAKNVNWLSEKEPRLPLKIKAKIRYRSELVSGILSKFQVSSFKLQFSKKQRAITPGQSVAFYLGNELLGGGIIV